MFSRRKLLTGGGASLSVLLAGCVFNDGMEPVPDLFLSNDTDTGATLSLRVIRLPSETEILSDTVTIGADEYLTYDDPITQAGEHRITISWKGGDDDRRTKHVWGAGGTNDSGGLMVPLDPGGTIEFNEFVA